MTDELTARVCLKPQATHALPSHICFGNWDDPGIKNLHLSFRLEVQLALHRRAIQLRVGKREVHMCSSAG